MSRVIEKLVKESGDTSPDEYRIYDLIDAKDQDGNAVQIRGNIRVVTIDRLNRKIQEAENRKISMDIRIAKVNAILTEISNLG